jgi:hypothetical protein
VEKEARPSSQAQAQKDARQIVSFPRITTWYLSELTPMILSN